MTKKRDYSPTGDPVFDYFLVDRQDLMLDEDLREIARLGGRDPTGLDRDGLNELVDAVIDDDPDVLDRWVEQADKTLNI